MIIKVFALSLISVTLALSCPIIVSAQQSKVIKFISADCSPAMPDSDGRSRTVSIILDDRNVLLNEAGDTPMSYLFTAEALFAINHKFKTYSVQSYDELEAMAGHKASEFAKSQERTGTRGDILLKLTEEIDTIHGFKVRKIMYLSKPEFEIWVSSDLIPVRLRTFGERLKAIFPANYWRKAGMAEIVILYGVPLKLVIDGNTVCRAEIHESTNSNPSFEVPADYKRVKANH